MRKLLHNARFAVLALLITLTAFSVSISADSGNSNSAAADESIVTTPLSSSEKTVVVENENYTFSMDAKTGDIIVKSKKTNEEWRSTPADYLKDKKAVGSDQMAMQSQLLMSYSDKSGVPTTRNSHIFSVKKGGLKVSKVNNGVLAVYTFPDSGITIPVEFILNNDNLEAKVLVNKIQEKNDKIKLNTISLLPFFDAGGLKDKGYLFVPDGSGAILNFNNNKHTSIQNYNSNKISDYNQYVYDRDAAIIPETETYVTQTQRLPVFGVKNNNNGFVGVITSGASRCMINANESGLFTSYNNVYSEFIYRDSGGVKVKGQQWDSHTIREYENNPSQIKNYDVKYYLLTGDNANYTGMALRYQKYLTDDEGLKSTVTNDNYPLYLDLYGSLRRQELFLGFPVQQTDATTTYSQATDIVKQLKANGVNNIVLKYDAWNNGGAQGSIPVDLKTERVLGGKSGFNQMSDYMKKNNVKTYLDVDIVDMFSSRWGYSKKFDENKGIDKSPSTVFSYDEATYQQITDEVWFLLRPDKVLSAATEMSNRLKDLNVTGLSLSTLGKRIYSNYPVKGQDRASNEVIWSNVAEKLKNVKGSIMFEEPNSYALPYATDVSSVPTDTSDFIVEDYSVPFYQIALHGITNYSVSPVNMRSDYKQSVLKALETGSSLNYFWVAQNSDRVKRTQYDYMFSVKYQDWIQDAITSYKEINPILSEVADKKIVKHEVLSNDVVKTTFENGLTITINYSDNPVTVNNTKIEAKGYVIGR